MTVHRSRAVISSTATGPLTRGTFDDSWLPEADGITTDNDTEKAVSAETPPFIETQRVAQHWSLFVTYR